MEERTAATFAVACALVGLKDDDVEALRELWAGIEPTPGLAMLATLLDEDALRPLSANLELQWQAGMLLALELAHLLQRPADPEPAAAAAAAFASLRAPEARMAESAFARMRQAQFSLASVRAFANEAYRPVAETYRATHNSYPFVDPEDMPAVARVFS